MVNSILEQEQKEDLMTRYNALEIDFNHRIDLLGVEFKDLLDKDLFDTNLSKYCRKFKQVSENSMSVRFMIPSEYGLPSTIKQAMEKVFNETFPNNMFR